MHKKIVAFAVLICVCIPEVFCMHGRWAHLDAGVERTLRDERVALRVTEADLGYYRDFGNLLVVVDHPVAVLRNVIYLSGNNPYMNEPPAFSLTKRTMLDIIFIGHRNDAVDLVYSFRIKSLLNLLLQPRNCFKRFYIKDMITEALDAEISRDYAADLERLLTALNTHHRDFAGVYREIAPLRELNNDRYDRLLAEYNDRFREYKGLQSRRFAIHGWDENSATHTEIMYLHDVFEHHHIATVEDLRRRAPLPALLEGSRRIYSVRPMCYVCEQAVVKSFRDHADISVISEMSPTPAERRRDNLASNVRKIDLR